MKKLMILLMFLTISTSIISGHKSAAGSSAASAASSTGTSDKSHKEVLDNNSFAIHISKDLAPYFNKYKIMTELPRYTFHNGKHTSTEMNFLNKADYAVQSDGSLYIELKISQPGPNYLTETQIFIITVTNPEYRIPVKVHPGFTYYVSKINNHSDELFNNLILYPTKK